MDDGTQRTVLASLIVMTVNTVLWVSIARVLLTYIRGQQATGRRERKRQLRASQRTPRSLPAAFQYVKTSKTTYQLPPKKHRNRHRRMRRGTCPPRP